MLKTVGNPATRYGDQTVVNGNLVVGTSGKGIDFAADSSAAGMTSELLNDYEEGTWTPTITASGGGITDPVYAVQSGTYTKIGRQVTIRCRLSLSSFTNNAGNYTRILGLPFVPVLDSVGSLMYSNFTSGTSGQIIAAIINTSAEVFLQKIDANGVVGAVGVNTSLLQQTASVDFTGTYFV